MTFTKDSYIMFVITVNDRKKIGGRIMSVNSLICDFKNDITGWKTNHGEDFANGSAMVLRNPDDVVKNVWHDVEPSEVYTIETRLKIKSVGREQGMKLERGHMRLFMYFYMGGIKCMGADGSYEIKLDYPGEFNTIKFRVIEKTAFVYMNGKLKAVYPLGPWRSDSCQLTYFLRSRGAECIPEIEVDYVNYIPEPQKLVITAPENNLLIKSGTELTLDTEICDPSVKSFRYYMNDTPISGEMTADNSKLTWNYPVAGEYYVTARTDDYAALGKWITVTEGVNSAKPAVIVSRDKLSFGEKVALSLDCTFDNVKKVTYFAGSEEVASEFVPAEVGKTLVYAKIEYTDGSYLITDATALTVSATCTEGIKLKRNYTLDFTAKVGTEIFASDGAYALDMTFGDGKLTYTTADGEKSYELGCGKYLLQIDSGVCDAYYEDQFAFSFRMPVTYAENGISATDAEDLVISGFNAEIIANKTCALPDFTNEYALEFTVDLPRDFTLKLCDGSYCIDLAAKDRVLTAKTYPNGAAGVIETENIGYLAEGRHVYRIPVANGIAQLFVDNVWVYSFRLPTLESDCSITMFDIDGVLVRETNDRYVFEDSFDGKAELPSELYYSMTDGVKADFENGAMTVSPSDAEDAKECIAYIKAYANNPVFKADIAVDSATEGGAYLAVRYTCEYRWLRAGYDFAEKVWKIESMHNKSAVLASVPADFPFGETVKLEFAVNKNSAVLYVNGKETVSANNVDLAYYGVMGVMADKVTVKVTYVGYVGTGRPIPGSATFLNDASTPEIFEHSPGRIFCVTGRMYESTDDGLTFTKVENPGYSNNTIRLKSGTIVSIHRRVADSGYIDYSFVSTDDGKTFEGPYPVQDYVINRITMNNKLTEGLNGRLLFASGESGDGVEGEGGIRVFYTDDEGRSWKGASIRCFDGTVVGGKNEARMDVHNTEVNCQESKIAVMPDGTMRLYVRTDEGFLYYSVSTDNGETWSAKMYTTPFITVLSAYNIEPDPVNGDYYMAWEYNIKNDHKTIQYPRTRVALAVSRDKMRTWEYVADIDEVADHNGDFGHMNIGLKPTTNTVFVDAVKYNPDGTGKKPGCNYMVRIAKNTMKTTARFTRPHVVGARGTASVFESEAMKNLLLVSTDGKYAKIGAKCFEFTDPKAGYVPLTAAAALVGGKLTVNGSEASVRIADLEVKFTAGEKAAYVNGSKIELSAPVAAGGDGIAVPTEAVAEAFSRKMAVIGDTVVYYFDRMDVANVEKLAQTAFWN